MIDNRVKVYTTPDCNLCKQAGKFLTEKGVEFDFVDITRDDAGLQEMRKISRGAKRVPVIKVGDNVLVGFDKGELEKALSSV